jgi:hypothetical protein
MRTLAVARFALCMSAAPALLASCGGSQPPIGGPGAIPQSRAVATREDETKSWMDPQASAQDLLYISGNTSGNVYVYTYPQGQLVGTLTGFIFPSGECADAAGDVFVVAFSALSMKSSTIYEYAHAGTTPIATLSDPNVAFGCAVDPTTGNLAVSGGGVAIYKHASGKARLYFSSVALNYCGYDDLGNLYLSGINSQSGEGQLYRWSRGGSRLEAIELGVTLYMSSTAPSVQWDGKYLTASSSPYQKPMTIYRLHISGSKATVVGSTILTARVNSYSGQTWIQGKTIIGYGVFKRGYQNAYFWPYPKGGEPERAIRKVAHTKQRLWGVAISVASSR